jgi:hypothetical protein
MKELNSRIDEEEADNDMSRSLIDNLKITVAKLTQREHTTDTYVRDLETRLKDHGDKLEILDQASIVGKKNILEFQRDIVRREALCSELEERLKTSNATEANIASELDERNSRLAALERGMEELRSKKGESELEVERLMELLAKVEERASVVDDIERLGSPLSLPTPVSALSKNGDHVVEPVELKEAESTVDVKELAELRSRCSDALRQLALAHQERDTTLTELSALRIKFDNISTPQSRINVNSPVTPARNDTFNESDSPPKSPISRRIPLASSSSSNLSIFGVGTGRRVSVSSRSHSRSASLSSSTAPWQTQSLATPPPTNSARDSRSFSTSGSDPLLSPRNGSSEVILMKEVVSRLQSGLLMKEEEISKLNGRLHDLREASSTLVSSIDTDTNSLLHPSSTDPIQRATSPQSISLRLSPLNLAAFDTIRNELNHSDSTVVGQTSESDRLHELMKSMAINESCQREEVDRLSNELVKLEKQHRALICLAADQMTNITEEIESLLKLHGEAMEQNRFIHSRAILSEQGSFASKLDELSTDHLQQLATSDSTHSNTLTTLSMQHGLDLASLREHHNTVVTSLTNKHAEVNQDAKRRNNDLVNDLAALTLQLEQHDSRSQNEILQLTTALAQAENDGLASQTSLAKIEAARSQLEIAFRQATDERDSLFAKSIIFESVQSKNEEDLSSDKNVKYRASISELEVELSRSVSPPQDVRATSPVNRRASPLPPPSVPPPSLPRVTTNPLLSGRVSSLSLHSRTGSITSIAESRSVEKVEVQVRSFSIFSPGESRY